jgi:hypothetical protein
VGHRIYKTAGISKLQALLHARQIAQKAALLQLKDPIFFFPHGGEAVKVAIEMKVAGFDLVHILMDYELPQSLRHAEVADVVLVIPDRAFVELKTRFGKKVYRLRQFGTPYLRSQLGARLEIGVESIMERSIPTPQLLYLGAMQERLDRILIFELLNSYPEWHMVSFGPGRIEVPNHHVLPWLPAEQLTSLLKPGAIGFLPYRLDQMKDLHCVPLKLFDFFEAGMPVVATPIAYLEKRPAFAYLGRTTSEIADAIRQALAEPANSPLKDRRRAFAHAHSSEQNAEYLAPLLKENGAFPPEVWTRSADAFQDL